MSNPRSLEVTISDTNLGGKKKIKVRFVTSCHNVFFNAQHLFLQLSPIQRCFFDYLVEQMNMDNSIFIDEKVKDGFVAFFETVKTSDQKAPSIRTMQSYMTKLVSLKLLMGTMTKGIYYINPKYVSKGSKADRISNIENLFALADTGEVDPSPLLNEPKEFYYGK